MKETFQDYAMDKLALMKNLRLADADSIHLLIGGIGSRALRGTAAALRAQTIDEFLEEMNQIADAASDHSRKQSPQQAKTSKAKESGGKAKNGQPEKTKPEKENSVCGFCHRKGHLRVNCYKLKTLQGEQTKQPNPVEAVAAVAEEAEETPTVAFVQEPKARNLTVNGTSIRIYEINNISCSLSALLDTGSPISFIKSGVFLKYFQIPLESLKVTPDTYKAINNTPIRLYGSIQATIRLESAKEDNYQHASIERRLVVGRHYYRSRFSRRQ